MQNQHHTKYILSCNARELTVTTPPANGFDTSIVWTHTYCLKVEFAPCLKSRRVVNSGDDPPIFKAFKSLSNGVKR